MMRQERRNSISWVKKQARKNGSMIVCSDFFAPYENLSQVKNAIKTLRKSKIEVFFGMNENDAVFVHSEHKELNMTSSVGVYCFKSGGLASILFSMKHALDL